MNFYTVKEVWEDVLDKKVSLPTIYSLIRKKRIPSIKIGGRIFVREEAFHNWVKKQEMM
jgi:excisionase family DNA binding protein